MVWYILCVQGRPEKEKIRYTARWSSNQKAGAHFRLHTPFGQIIRADFKDSLSATPFSPAKRGVRKKRGGTEPGLPCLREADIHRAGLARQSTNNLMNNSNRLQITVDDSLHSDDLYSILASG